MIVGVGVGVTLEVAVSVDVEVAVALEVATGVAVGVGEGDTAGVRVAVQVGIGDGDAVGVQVDVGVGEGDAVSVATDVQAVMLTSSMKNAVGFALSLVAVNRTVTVCPAYEVKSKLGFAQTQFSAVVLSTVSRGAINAPLALYSATYR